MKDGRLRKTKAGEEEGAEANVHLARSDKDDRTMMIGIASKIVILGGEEEDAVEISLESCVGLFLFTPIVMFVIVPVS